MFSPNKIQGMTGRHGLGGTCSHIKAFGFSLVPTLREILYWRIAGLTYLRNAGKNTDICAHTFSSIVLFFYNSFCLPWGFNLCMPLVYSVMATERLANYLALQYVDFHALHNGLIPILTLALTSASRYCALPCNENLSLL